MILIKSIEEIKKPFDRAVVTIGNFDGVHIGHQALFHHVIEEADDIKGVSVAITFDPHPIRVLKQNGQPPLITLKEQKIELIEKVGIDVLIVIPFTKSFSKISAREFVEEILIRKIGMRVLVIGKDYTFGKKREGNINLLTFYSEAFDFKLVVLDWIRDPDNIIKRASSTRIRELVMAGRVSDAKKMLGRHYQVRGIVKPGRNRGGRLLGFPTANIMLQDELCPKTGVYAVIVEIEGRKFSGVANIGFSPTFDDGLFTVEVHILDFSGDLYDMPIKVNFIKRLRDEMKFSGIKELKAQISKDIHKGRVILAGEL